MSRQALVVPQTSSTQYLEGRLKYKVGAVLGEGHYSKVRIIEDENGVKSAVKIICKKETSRNYKKKFLPREIKVLRSLNHPNIVKTTAFRETPFHLYMFMELAEGGDMHTYIKRHNFVEEDVARNFFRQLVSAVQYLHERGIAHRDIKCENALLDASHQKVFLTDFSFSRICVDQTTGKDILSNTHCGSTSYLAPEVLQGLKYHPKLADIWALGCTLFYMVAGEPPFQCWNLHKMVTDQLHRILPPFRHPVSNRCHFLIRDMLEPDLTRRLNISKVQNSKWLTAGPN